MYRFIGFLCIFFLQSLSWIKIFHKGEWTLQSLIKSDKIVDERTFFSSYCYRLLFLRFCFFFAKEMINQSATFECKFNLNYFEGNEKKNLYYKHNLYHSYLMYIIHCIISGCLILHKIDWFFFDLFSSDKLKNKNDKEN